MRPRNVYFGYMQVYVELALAENFCMDFTLLACAKFICKNRCGYRRIAFASLLGACFAVAFPLFGLKGAPAVAVKLLSGIALAAVAGRFSRFKQYLKFAAVFLAVSFLSGGAMVALFSLAGWEYSSGGGFLISSVPVGIPLFISLVLALSVKAVANRVTARRCRADVECEIFVGQKSVRVGGFFDSGNRVYSGGCPVSVIPLAAACALVDVPALREQVGVSTVAGSKRMKIFIADKMVIYNGAEAHTINCVKIGISPRHIARAVLHPDLAEEESDVR